MSDYTHADLLAAIDKFQRGVEAEMYEHYQPTLLRARGLRAILDLHPEHRGTCPYCLRTWPCSNVASVTYALRKMGAL